MLESISIYLVIGIFAGTLSGMLGIGSGSVIVPALVFVFSREHFPPAQIMHMAAGTSLSVIVFTTSRTLLSHLKRNILFWYIYKRIFPGVIVGTVVGALLADALHSRTLGIIFGIVISLLGLKMIFHITSKTKHKLPGIPLCSFMGFLIGGKSGLLGLGGGAVSIPFLTYYRVSIREAIVVSSAIGVTVSVIGSISFAIMGLNEVNLPSWTTGYIYWPASLSIIVGGLSFVPLGVKLSHCFPMALLRRIFAVFLLVAGIHMLYVIFA